MAVESARGATPMPHRHWNEDELFELAAGLARAGTGADDDANDGATCEHCRARLSAVAAGLQTLRSVAAERRSSESELTERILSATVRESVDWRGDVELVSRFVRERLRSSAWLRFAAALLFIHAAALPVLAWIVLRSERSAPHFFSSLESLPRESAFADPLVEPSPPLESGEAAEPRLVELGADESSAKARWTLERERQAAALRAFDWPVTQAASRPSEALALRLWVRARQATHGLTPPTSWASDRARWNSADVEPARLHPLALDALALELEIELDRVARGGLERTAREMCERWAPQIRGGRSELAQWALARAARLGVIRGEPSGLDGAGASEASAISGALFDASWFAALRRAVNESESAHDARAPLSHNSAALVQSWLARGEQR